MFDKGAVAMQEESLRNQSSVKYDSRRPLCPFKSCMAPPRIDQL